MSGEKLTGFQEFRAHYQFNPDLALYVSAEVECHIVRGGKIAPIADEVLGYLWRNSNGLGECFTYELSRCQLEYRLARPCKIQDLRANLALIEEAIGRAEKEVGFSRLYVGSAPDDVPLDHYPVERYDRIVKGLTAEKLRAACRVAGVHIHVGMPSHEVALRVYNRVIQSFYYLCRIGITEDRLFGYCQTAFNISTRMELFEEHLMSQLMPPSYESWERFYDRAKKEGFTDDPRRVWDFIRISKHGTVEFRMFDTTSDIDEIVFWARVCHGLCSQAMVE